MRDWRDRAHAAEMLFEPFQDLANAVADYLRGQLDRKALGEALIPAATALGMAVYVGVDAAQSDGTECAT
jgi:hypothetical protein